MDNVTHTLAGFLVAELAVRARERRGEPTAHWARPAYFTSALANNLPDLDFVYAGITAGPLGYLLHHRGHTHTLALAPLLAGLTLALGLVWLSRSGGTPTRADRLWLAGLALVGALLHIAMDFSNSYGVHPFWPLDPSWYYGDTIFIVEPLFWALTLPALIAQVRWVVGRVVLGLLLAATVALPWVSGFVPPVISGIVTALTVLSVVLSFKLAPARRAAVALGGSLGVLVVFAVTSFRARSVAAAELERAFPGARSEDLALSPLPANPLCWSLLAVQIEGERYVVRRGVVALAPGLLPAARCPNRASGNTTAPLVPLAVDSGPSLSLSAQFSAELGELRALAAGNCQVAGLLRFARVPYWKDDGDAVIVGDLRYDRGPGLEFAELRTPRTAEQCPRFVPGWRPPRAKTLE